MAFRPTDSTGGSTQKLPSTSAETSSLSGSSDTTQKLSGVGSSFRFHARVVSAMIRSASRVAPSSIGSVPTRMPTITRAATAIADSRV